MNIRTLRYDDMTKGLSVTHRHIAIAFGHASIAAGVRYALDAYEGADKSTLRANSDYPEKAKLIGEGNMRLGVRRALDQLIESGKMPEKAIGRSQQLEPEL